MEVYCNFDTEDGAYILFIYSNKKRVDTISQSKH